MLSESSLIDMNASTSDNSYGHQVDSPTFFKCIYDTDLFPESSANGNGSVGGGGGGTNGNNMLNSNGNGAAHCFGTSKMNGQNNSSSASEQNYNKMINNHSDVGCLQSPASNNGGHFTYALHGSPYGYQQQNICQPSAAMIGNIPSSPGYNNGATSVVAAGPFGSPNSANGTNAASLFSPNPMPDSTTNFLQQQQQQNTNFTSKQTTFGVEHRRSLDSSVYVDGGPKTPLGVVGHDSFYQPLRTGSVSGDFAFGRFGDTPKLGKILFGRW